ncbi:MAG: hypothetical protein BYD32DRAFT_217420 [Podila humilis]|nr:MAG: hypothetical protein BYD32DRAFT_217420 [Podila humilis]
MAPPHVIDDQVRRRIVVEDEIKPKKQFERNYVPMDLTIKEIRDAIPAHLFIRDTTKSIIHVVKDLVTIAAIFYCATFIDTLPSLALRIPAWIAYWIIQGTVMVGPWILAHGKLAIRCYLLIRSLLQEKIRFCVGTRTIRNKQFRRSRRELRRSNTDSADKPQNGKTTHLGCLS